MDNAANNYPQIHPPPFGRNDNNDGNNNGGVNNERVGGRRDGENNDGNVVGIRVLLLEQRDNEVIGRGAEEPEGRRRPV